MHSDKDITLLCPLYDVNQCYPILHLWAPSATAHHFRHSGVFELPLMPNVDPSDTEDVFIPSGLEASMSQHSLHHPSLSISVFLCFLSLLLDPSNTLAGSSIFLSPFAQKTRETKCPDMTEELRRYCHLLREQPTQRDQLTCPKSCSTQSAGLRCLQSFIHPACTEGLYDILGIVLGTRGRAMERQAKTSVHKRE